MLRASSLLRWRRIARTVVQSRAVTATLFKATAFGGAVGVLGLKVATCEGSRFSPLFGNTRRPGQRWGWGAKGQAGEGGEEEGDSVTAASPIVVASTTTINTDPLVDSLRRAFREFLAIAADLFRAAQLALIFTPAAVFAVPVAAACESSWFSAVALETLYSVLCTLYSRL